MTFGDCTYCHGTGWVAWHTIDMPSTWTKCQNCSQTGNTTQQGVQLPEPDKAPDQPEAKADQPEVTQERHDDQSAQADPTDASDPAAAQSPHQDPYGSTQDLRQP